MPLEDTTEKLVEQELSDVQKITTPVQSDLSKEPRFLSLEEIEAKPKPIDIPVTEGRDWVAEFNNNLNLPVAPIDVKPNIDTASKVTPNKDNSYDFNLDFRTEEEIKAGTPVEREIPTFSEFVKFMYKDADADIIASSHLRRGMYNQIDARLSLELGDKAYLKNMPKEHLELKFTEAPVTKMAGETAAMMPFILETVQAGVLYGIPLALVYGGKRALTRAAIPLPAQAKFILGLEGFIAGMKTGMAFSVIKTSIDVEGALIFGDLIREGVDDDTARVLSLAAGLMIGLTELAQLSLFSATYRRVFGKMVGDEKAKAAIKVALLTALETVGYNPTQEVVQEVIELATLGLASVIDNNPSVMPKRDGIWNRLADVWLRTFQGSVFLGILGGIAGGFGQRSRNRKLRREAFKKMALSLEKERAEDDIIVVKEEEVEGFGEDALARAKRIAKAKTEAFIKREGEGAPEHLKVRQEDITKKFERGEIDRRTFERRKLDLLQFESREAFVEGINTISNFELLPDSAVSFVLKSPELFKKELVDFAEKKGIPKGTPSVEVKKIVEKRREERRQVERRHAEIAKAAETLRILRGEEVTELSKAQKEALAARERERRKPVEIEVEGQKVLQFKRKDIPARITFLKDDIKRRNKQLDKILTRVSQEKVQANIDKLHRDTLRLLEEQAKIQKEITELQNINAKLTFDLGAKKVTLRASEVIALQMNAIKKMIEGIERGKRLGMKITRKQIRELQIGLVNFVKQTETDPAIRARALAAIAEVQTPEQMEKHIAKFESQVEKAAEKALKRLLINNIKKLTKSKKLRKVSQDFKEQIDSILAPFSVVKPTAKTTAKLFWAAKQLQENDANQITPEELTILRELDKTPLVDISVRDLQLVHDSIAHLIHLNTERQKLNEQNRNERQQKNLDEAELNLRENFEQLDHSITNLDDMHREPELQIFKGFGRVSDLVGVAAWNTELISEILDGKDDGIIMQVLYNEIDKGTSIAINYRTESEQFLIDAGVRDLVDKTWSESFTRMKSNVKKFNVTLDSGLTLTLRRGTRISFMLLKRNNNTLRQLTEGGFVFPRDKHAQAVKLTKADLERIEESATASEKKVADIINVYFNSFQKERLNEVFERLYGFSVAVEDNYFPAHVSEIARKVSVEEYKGLASSDEFVRNVLEGLGIFKKRRGGTEALVVSDAFDVLTDSIRKTSNFIGLAEPLRDAKALFNAPEFKVALVNANKGKYLASLKDYLEKVEGSVFNNDNVGKIVQNWQSKIDVAVLAGNLKVFLKQPVSYLLASTEINMKYIIAGMRPVASDALVERIRKWSPPLRERFNGKITLETGEIAGMGAARRLILGKTLMSQKAMIGIHKFDKMAITSIWRAVEFETRAGESQLKGDAFNEHVADRAWKIIRRTQPTFDMKDRSYTGRTSNTWLRLSTKYTSQRNKNWMIQRRLIERWNRSEGGAKNLGKLFAGLILVNLIASSMIAGVNALGNLGVKDKKDEIDEEEWENWKKFGVDVIRTVIGNTYIIGNILDIALTKAVERKRGFGMTDPVSRTFEQTGELIGDIGKGIELTVGEKPRYRKGRVKAEKERKKLIERMIRNSIDITSKISGVPVYSTLKSLEIISTATGLVDKDEDVKRYKKRRY